MKKGTILKNLWAGYETYFIYMGFPVRVADHLLSHGVTIVEDHTGETVFALFDVSEYMLKSGKVKERAIQIYTFRHLRRALRFGNVEVLEKVCTKTDSGRIGNTVFLTREEAEAVVDHYRKE